MAKGKYEYWLTPEGLVLLEGWARDGLTDEQIAHNMGINKATLYRWKEKYCDICNALKIGKAVVDRQVENALLKRALGYSYSGLLQRNRLCLMLQRRSIGSRTGSQEIGEISESRMILQQLIVWIRYWPD